MKFASNRTDFILNLAKIDKKDSVLTVGVAHIPEIERIIENKAKKTTCIDVDLKKINNAKKYVKNTRFILGDITKKDKKLFNKFDTIIMLEVLEHLEDDMLALNNVNNMLKKNGKLIITVPNKNPLHLFNPLLYTQHKRHYKMNEILEKLKKSGFKIIYRNNVESPKLLFNLYVHLICKFILRKTIEFGVLTGKRDRTYERNNKESKALDSLVVAVKI